MRIMLDTNVLISSIIFKSKIMNEMLAAILKEHRVVFSFLALHDGQLVILLKNTSRFGRIVSDQ